jgi:type I restriction enzyme S subunit
MRHKFEDIAINNISKQKPVDEDMQTYIGLEHLDTGELLISRYGSKVPIKGEKLIMAKGDVLFGRRNTYLRRAAIAPHDGLFSAHGMVLRPKEDVIDKDFFPFFIGSDYFFDAAIRISVGSLSPTVNWGQLKHLEFDLPTISEQQRLATLLWSANDVRNSYRELLTITDELVKSRFVEMFGDPDKNEKCFPLVSLKDCCIINPRKSEDKRLINGLEVSFVPMAAVSEKGTADVTEVRLYDDVRSGFTYFAEIDVLFAKITPCMENGKGAIMEGLLNGIGFGSTEFHVLRPITGVSNPFWLYQITAFDKFRKDAAMNMTGSAGQRRVPISYLENYQTGLPPIDLQNRFADFVRAADKSKFSHCRRPTRLEQAVE